MSWHNMFKENILNRGFEYYKKGAVTDIYKIENTINAVVKGSEDYEVTVELKNGKPEYMYCSCPYADDGKNCKHMAAVLFEWEFSQYDSEGTSSENIEELVKKAERNIIDSFLIKKLSENEELLAEFKITVNQNVSREDIIRYKRMIDNIIDDNAYGGYVSYRDAYDFACEIQNFIHSYIDVMTEKNCLKEAFELVGYLYNSMAEVEMDSSGGELDIIIDSCMEEWKAITDNADIILKKQLFNSFISIINKNRNEYFVEEAEDFLVENFTEYDFLEKELLTVIKKIHNAERNHSYISEKWHLQVLKIYSNMGKDLDFIENYCNNHKFFPGVRRYYVDRCLEYNQYDKAITMLKESIKLDKKYPGIVESHMFALKNIYIYIKNWAKKRNTGIFCGISLPKTL